MGYKPLEHLLEMIILGLAVTFRMKDAVVNGPVLGIVTRRVNEVDQANAFQCTARAAPHAHYPNTVS